MQSCTQGQPEPVGLRCAVVQQSNAFVPVCGVDRPCRPGWGCIINHQTKIGGCEPRCSRPSECPTTGLCDPYSGLCQAPGPGLGLNQECTRGEQCKSGVCFPTGGEIKGFCASQCRLDDPVCPEGAACIRISNDPGYSMGLCFFDCVNGACAPGFRCNQVNHCIPKL